MNNSKIEVVVPTYHDDGRGHADPQMPVEVHVGQGIQLTLRPPSADGAGPDVYVERRDGRWTVNISPDSNDVRVVVNIFDGGTITATDGHGTQVLLDEPPTT